MREKEEITTLKSPTKRKYKKGVWSPEQEIMIGRRRSYALMVNNVGSMGLSQDVNNREEIFVFTVGKVNLALLADHILQRELRIGFFT